MKLVKLHGLFHPFIQYVSALSFIIVIGYGGMLVIYGDISLGDFIAFNSYLSLLVWPVMAVGWLINVMQRGTASMERLNKIFDESPEITEADTPIKLDYFQGNIEFQQISFKYPNSSVNALEDFSVKIPSGKSLGVIGKTGSGKTTIATLLLRLYDVDKGQILLDGKPIKDLKLEDLRGNIGYVDQDSFLFSTTLAENIAFGVESFHQWEVERVAKMAEVHDNIMDFPEQYKTFVGERGVTLSGGQKQRTSIARSLMKNPQVLILDDSLSAVDTDTEEKILNNLKTEMKGKTNIIIAHRISTIKECDEIIVLEDGKIIEQGNHEALLQNQKSYYELYQKQLLEDKIASEE